MQQFSIKKALPYSHGVFLASGVFILLIYRDLSDFFTLGVETRGNERNRFLNRDKLTK